MNYSGFPRAQGRSRESQDVTEAAYRTRKQEKAPKLKDNVYSGQGQPNRRPSLGSINVSKADNMTGDQNPNNTINKLYNN